ncbi:MAG TPA: DUF4386 family protein [Anaerolineales bacterium]|nr:DUF4386 family protein [Anaerolineales bacterium]HND48147.1 DUF4386 family protein [Anaerolineales bacterium]
MKDNSLYKLGGFASIIVGISYVVIGITTVLLPPNLAGVPEAQSPFMFFEANRGLLMTQYWAFTIGAIFALAMIPAVSATVQHLNEGWVRWTSSLATLGFVAAILDNYWAIVVTPARAAMYTTGSEVVRAALSIPGEPQVLDVQGWLASGGVGLWVLVIGLLALRGKVFPKGLAYLWIIGAFTYFMSLAASVIPDLYLSGVVIAVSSIGAVLAPVGYGWMGWWLWNKAQEIAP